MASGFSNNGTLQLYWREKEFHLALYPKTLPTILLLVRSHRFDSLKQVIVYTVTCAIALVTNLTSTGNPLDARFLFAVPNIN